MTDTSASPALKRFSTGNAALDQHLGGGLLPGTLTVVVGATGIGKTQWGVSFAQAGKEQEGKRGVIFDMTSRGDAQSQQEYAQRMYGWKLAAAENGKRPELDVFFERLEQAETPAEYLHVFDVQGRRISRRDLNFDDWQDWKAELAAKLETSIGFFYGHFVRGVRRVVIDGIEPARQATDSIQLEMFEYIYHQILRKDAEWVARDLFRQHYRTHSASVAAHLYQPSHIGCALLYTSHESMLDQLIERPLDEGDLLTNANTIVYLGKIRDGIHLTRALYIAKHRGSYCSDQIHPYTITAEGLQLVE